MLGERFEEEGIGTCFSRPRRRGQDAENQDGDIARSRVRFELTAEGQSVEVGNQDLRDDDIRGGLPSELQGATSVLREPDGVPSPVQEVRLELADMRIAIDDQDDRLASSFELSVVRHSPPPTGLLSDVGRARHAIPRAWTNRYPLEATTLTSYCRGCPGRVRAGPEPHRRVG